CCMATSSRFAAAWARAHGMAYVRAASYKRICATASFVMPEVNEHESAFCHAPLHRGEFQDSPETGSPRPQYPRGSSRTRHRGAQCLVPSIETASSCALVEGRGIAPLHRFFKLTKQRRSKSLSQRQVCRGSIAPTDARGCGRVTLPVMPPRT